MRNKNIYRLASLFILISLLVGTKMVVSASSQYAPLKATAFTFNPVADAYDSNYCDFSSTLELSSGIKIRMVFMFSPIP